MPDDWFHEDTDDPLHPDRRNFYKVEKWSRHPTRVTVLLRMAIGRES
jgi:hypothetical protein